MISVTLFKVNFDELNINHLSKRPLLDSIKIFYTGNEFEYLENYIGKEIEVLFEENTQEDIFEGFTSNYLKVRVRSKENIQNKILTVKVTKREDLKLVGNII